MPECSGHAVGVPCFNEAERPDVEGFLDVLASAGHLLVVDVGSTDRTHSRSEVQQPGTPTSAS